ncbi:putative UPF0481 protein At3g02645 [Coffea eugenioides]|uniref:putative UPF0481 protein At3g02645 n=1 Tax=Coffea eugenioides TaxID=49369 RepID=UPI000F60A7DE|nr:putative UPF0481 protein At3g02645 [Coffea eugenioides]
MSSNFSSKSSTSNGSHRSWAEQTKDRYRHPYDIGPSVFEVPKRLSDTKPDAYAPRKVGLGPYHHLRPDLQLMTNKKRDTVKVLLKIEDIEEFIRIVENCPISFEAKIRSCYSRSIDLDRESLAWIVIIDAMFLLHLVQAYTEKRSDSGSSSTSSSSDESFLGDIVMLENQVPTLLMEEIPKFLQYKYPVPPGKDIGEALCRFCYDIAPIEIEYDPNSELDYAMFKARGNHILQYVYDICLGVDRELEELQEETYKRVYNGKVKAAQHIWAVTQHVLSRLTEPIKLGVDEFPNTSIDQDEQQGNLLPSVSQLHDVCETTFTCLLPASGIQGTVYDVTENVFFLPTLKLGKNSEVMLRNLLAFEASAPDLSSVFQNFIYLLPGLIRGEKDVKILRNAQIVKGEMENDEVVCLFAKLRKPIIANGSDKNEMSTADEFGNALRKQFSNNPFVKTCIWIKNRIVAFFNLLKPLVPALIVLLLLFQSFCQIYDCRRFSLPILSDGKIFRDASSFLSFNSTGSQAQDLMSARKILRYSS